MGEEGGGGQGKPAGICCPPPVNEKFHEMGFFYTSRQYLYFVKHIRLWLLKQLTAITKS